eukprot:314002-Hanusia_phi.AAC.2
MDVNGVQMGRATCACWLRLIGSRVFVDLHHNLAVIGTLRGPLRSLVRPTRYPQLSACISESCEGNALSTYILSATGRLSGMGHTRVSAACSCLRWKRFERSARDNVTTFLSLGAFFFLLGKMKTESAGGSPPGAGGSFCMAATWNGGAIQNSQNDLKHSDRARNLLQSPTPLPPSPVCPTCEPYRARYGGWASCTHGSLALRANQGKHDPSPPLAPCRCTLGSSIPLREGSHEPVVRES